MSLRLQPVSVATGSPDTTVQLAFADGSLVAVLVQLSDGHEASAGMWFLETAFGWVRSATAPTFADLDVAEIWIEQRLTHTA